MSAIINGAATTTLLVTSEREHQATSSSSTSISCTEKLRRRNLTISVAATPSFFGNPTPRLQTYNPLKSPYLEITLPGAHRGWQTDKWLWLQSLVCCSVAIAIGFLTPSEAKSALEEQRDTVEGIASTIATLVAFVVGGFVTHVVGAWQERRTNYASLIGSMRNLLLTMSSCVSLSSAAGQQRDAAADSGDTVAAHPHARLIRASRAILGRYVLLACELAVLKPRGHLDSLRGRSHLEALGLLAPDEWDGMVPGDRHTSVLCWVHALCVDLSRRGLLSDTELKVLLDGVSAARAQANDLMSCLSRDLPMPYTNQVAWLVRLAVLLQTVAHGLQICAMDDASCKVYAAIGVFLYAFFFLSFLGMHRVLHNPFLERLIDVGHEPIANEGLARLAESLMRDTAYLPPRWPPAGVWAHGGGTS